MPFLCPVCMAELNDVQGLKAHFQTHEAGAAGSAGPEGKKTKKAKKEQLKLKQSVPTLTPRRAQKEAALPPAVEGWLTKRGNRNKRSWKMRWFEAYPGFGGAINYYKDETRSKLLGTIPLSDATVRPMPNPDQDTWLFAVVTSKRVWEFAALSAQARERWMTVLGYSTIPKVDQLIMEAEQMIVRQQVDTSLNPFDAQYLPKMLPRSSYTTAHASSAGAGPAVMYPSTPVGSNGGIVSGGRVTSHSSLSSSSSTSSMYVRRAPLPPQRRASVVEIATEAEVSRKMARRLSGLDIPTMSGTEQSDPTQLSSGGDGRTFFSAPIDIEMAVHSGRTRAGGGSGNIGGGGREGGDAASGGHYDGRIAGYPPGGSGSNPSSPPYFGGGGDSGGAIVTTAQTAFGTGPSRPASRGALGGGGAASVAAAIEQLAVMGFTDRAANLEALARHGGDIGAAVEELVAAGSRDADSVHGGGRSNAASIVVNGSRSNYSSSTSPPGSSGGGGGNMDSGNYSYSSLGPDGSWRDYTAAHASAISAAIRSSPHQGVVQIPGLPFEFRWGNAAVSARMPNMPTTRMIQVNATTGATRVARCNAAQWPSAADSVGTSSGAGALAALVARSAAVQSKAPTAPPRGGATGAGDSDANVFGPPPAIFSMQQQQPQSVKSVSLSPPRPTGIGFKPAANTTSSGLQQPLQQKPRKKKAPVPAPPARVSSTAVTTAPHFAEATSRYQTPTPPRPAPTPPRRSSSPARKLNATTATTNPFSISTDGVTFA